MMLRGTAAWLAALALCAGGCSADQGPAVSGADRLRALISTDAVMAHLRQLQDIADRHGGTRQSGTPGYDASVDYVAKLLRDKGFDVQTPEFPLSVFDVTAESLTVGGGAVPATAVNFSGSSGPSGVTGALVAVPSDATPGCEATDYTGLPIGGAVALVDRGACTIAEKVAIAAQRGAVAIVIADDSDAKGFSAALWESDQARIPVVSVTRSEGGRLRAQRGASTTVVVDARVVRTTARNVIAQTTTGAKENVVLVGAHLDSVRVGPGINDNGSGVATVLEAALQLGAAPDVTNAVRFAFWGAEEEFIVGSLAYAKSLDAEALKDIALCLNFDTVGSPNPGYFVLDGDPAQDVEPGPPGGSPDIANAFADYFDDVGKPSQDFPFDRGGDYLAFAQAGIPVGGFTTGAEEVMTAEQAELWGGRAGEAFDADYHSADDTLANVNRAALDVTGPAIAYAVGRYAYGELAAQGIPSRAERVRQLVTE